MRRNLNGATRNPRVYITINFGVQTLRQWRLNICYLLVRCARRFLTAGTRRGGQTLFPGMWASKWSVCLCLCASRRRSRVDLDMNEMSRLRLTEPECFAHTSQLLASFNESCISFRHDPRHQGLVIGWDDVGWLSTSFHPSSHKPTIPLHSNSTFISADLTSTTHPIVPLPSSTHRKTSNDDKPLLVARLLSSKRRQ
jgi:hypothetical protein